MFQVDQNVTASISGLTITGGRGNNFGFGKGGGGLANYGGNLTLTDCSIAGNSIGGGDGGGLFNKSGSANLIDCTISGNSADYGGAIFTGGTTTLTNCMISENSDSQGGVFVNGGSTVLTGCTVSGNTSSEGGRCLHNHGAMTLIDCTVSGNSASGNGGGLFNHGGHSDNDPTQFLKLTNCTVSGNSASGSGGGVYAYLGSPYNSYGHTIVGNTIIAGNSAATGPDVSGTTSFNNLLNHVISSQGNNLIGETDGSSGWVDSDLTGTIAAPLDALLVPLGNYGGPIQTMGLLPGSPAIDAGNNALIPGGVTNDPRGCPASSTAMFDIGAFESSGFTIAVTSGSGQTARVFAPLVVTVTANNPIEPVAGGQVTFIPLAIGASADLADNPATISSSGAASVTATSNGFPGSYTVSATASGAPVAALVQPDEPRADLDRGLPRQSGARRGRGGAVRRHGHLRRRLDRGRHGFRELGVGDDLRGDNQR